MPKQCPTSARASPSQCPTIIIVGNCDADYSKRRKYHTFLFLSRDCQFPTIIIVGHCDGHCLGHWSGTAWALAGPRHVSKDQKRWRPALEIKLQSASHALRFASERRPPPQIWGNMLPTRHRKVWQVACQRRSIKNMERPNFLQ